MKHNNFTKAHLCHKNHFIIDMYKEFVENNFLLVYDFKLILNFQTSKQCNIDENAKNESGLHFHKTKLVDVKVNVAYHQTISS